jgi:hypothetical protein
MKKIFIFALLLFFTIITTAQNASNSNLSSMEKRKNSVLGKFVLKTYKLDDVVMEANDSAAAVTTMYNYLLKKAKKEFSTLSNEDVDFIKTSSAAKVSLAFSMVYTFKADSTYTIDLVNEGKKVSVSGKYQFNEKESAVTFLKDNGEKDVTFDYDVKTETLQNRITKKNKNQTQLIYIKK